MEEKRAKELKREAAAELGEKARRRRAEFEAIDERLNQYLQDVAEHSDEHNLYECLAAVRFVRFFDKYDFRAKKARRFIRFYEKLKFSGLQGRRSYKLTPVQVFQFANILGFYDSAGRRLTREVILFVPRKFSKTTSTASLAAHELLFGDSNAQAYTGANSYKQAQICFKEIRQLAAQIDPGMRHFKTTREHIEWRAPNEFGKESFVECLTGGAETKDGLAASLVIMDEYAQARYVKGHSDGAALLNVLRSSMGTRRDPLVIIITTASRTPDGPFALELESAKKVLTGEYEDDHLFASLFLPDPWDFDNLGSPLVWRKCNPHIGVTVSEEFYENKWIAAQRDAEQMIEFKTKLVNVFTSDSSKEWLPRRLLESLAVEKLPAGRLPTMCAIDLSVSDDFSAVSYCAYSKSERIFYITSDYYIPEETLAEHPNRDLYKQWVKFGYMKICKGAVIDYGDIIADILRNNESKQILQIGYDSYKSQEVVNALSGAIGRSRSKKILTPVPQTYGAFTSPVETFEMAVKSRPANVRFADNPIQIYCFANAYLDEDKMGNKKPLKRKANLKIDSAITTLMCFWLWNNYQF